jgi:integrase
MALGKVTEKSLAALRAAAQRQEKLLWLWDTETKGFGVRASATGSVGFVFQHWAGGRGGKAKRFTLAATSLEAARIEADAKRHDANRGCLTSPRQERLTAEREELQRKSIGEVVSLYLSTHKQPGRYWSELEAQFNNQILPLLKSRAKLDSSQPITALDKTHLRELLRALDDKPATKRKTYSALSPLLKWALSEDYIARNPILSVPPPKIPESRERVLTREEIKALWSGTSSLSPLWCSFYRLLLLTAQRREEVSNMEWREITDDVWCIPSHKTKNGKEHVVHLSPQAIAALPQKGDSPYVFPSKAGTPICGYSKTKALLDRKSGVEEWRVHDLRRTARSGFAELGISREVAEKVLNHVSGVHSGLDAIYNRYEYLPERRDALISWGSYIEALVSDKTNLLNRTP